MLLGFLIYESQLSSGKARAGQERGIAPGRQIKGAKTCDAIKNVLHM